MTFGEKVKAERTKLGMSQDELAAKIGVTRRIIGSYENDKSRPRGMERYKKLAEVLNVNVNYLSYFYIDSLIKDLTPTVIDNSEVYQIDSNLKITYVKDNNIITNIIVNDSYNTYDLKYTKINKIPTIGETYEY